MVGALCWAILYTFCLRVPPPSCVDRQEQISAQYAALTPLDSAKKAKRGPNSVFLGSVAAISSSEFHFQLPRRLFSVSTREIGSRKHVPWSWML